MINVGTEASRWLFPSVTDPDKSLTTHGFVIEFGARCWRKPRCAISASTMPATPTLR